MAGQPTRAWSACHVYVGLAVPTASTGWTLLSKQTTSCPLRCRAEQPRISDQLNFVVLDCICTWCWLPSLTKGPRSSGNRHLWPQEISGCRTGYTRYSGSWPLSHRHRISGPTFCVLRLFYSATSRQPLPGLPQHAYGRWTSTTPDKDRPPWPG